MHPLDNPIWGSLTTRHARFALGSGPARRFVPEVGPLAGGERGAAESLAALTDVPPGGAVGFFLDEPRPEVPGWKLLLEIPLVQMVHDGRRIAPPEDGFVPLGADRTAEMVALARLTKPGPFDVRTKELGDFVGVLEDGELAAMAGERLKLPGFTEVSGVCTRPASLGRGHAARLMSVVAARIQARGETPFLHSRADNARAIALYERLGYARRALWTYAHYRRDGGAPARSWAD